jgi:DtxR family Mn-dependent transcriptional regulator
MAVTIKTSSTEDYLKTIASLSKQSSVVRVSDICNKLKVTAPSVSEALTRLDAAGLVKHPKHGHIQLTAQGAAIAHDINLRYETLLRFLVDVLKVPHEIAEKDACGMEHSLSSTSRKQLSKLVISLCEDYC